MRPVFDRRLAGLAPVISAVCARFRLRAPRSVRPLTAAEARTGERGFVDRDRVMGLGLRLRCPAWILAHECAHLRHWGHRGNMKVLAYRIMEWLQDRPDLLRRIERTYGRIG